VNNNDVSVVCDSAARLAYQGWCAKYDKPQEESRYEVFKGNYEALTVANVSATKQARDESGDWKAKAKQTLDLNEFADMTADEYTAAQSSDSSPAPAPVAEEEPVVEAPLTTGDVLGKALEAAEAQSEASSALVDAAEALAEEEEVRITTRNVRRASVCYNHITFVSLLIILTLVFFQLFFSAVCMVLGWSHDIMRVCVCLYFIV
jgi:hypothetical protein